VKVIHFDGSRPSGSVQRHGTPAAHGQGKGDNADQKQASALDIQARGARFDRLQYQSQHEPAGGGEQTDELSIAVD
jgi:hypothetical protein